ncbi:MAG: hypothetical protein SFY70_03660 [Bacteroidia bacterium]|nr:hypothetical protein [Bacteroidia bacterium]
MPRSAAARALGVLLLAQGLLLAVLALAGGQQVALAPGWSLRLPALAEVFDYAPTEPTAADSLLESVAADSAQLAVDLRRAYDPSQAKDSPYADSASLDAKIRLSNPLVGGTTPLDGFFEQLAAVDDSTVQLIRIGHYGDSQIEGDRVTMFLRRKFAEDFGGGGLGLLPIVEPTSHFSLERACSANWVRNTVFQNRASHSRYNYGGTVYHYGVGLLARPNPRYKAPVIDSTGKWTEVPKDSAGKPEPEFFYTPTGRMEADIVFRLRSGATYATARLLWGGEATTRLRVYQGKDVVYDDTLRGDGTYHELRLPIAAGTNPVKLRFDGPSPEVYGLVLDPWRGVQVDNLAIRGHSGNELVRIDDGFLAQQLRQHTVRLLILQYGGNVVPWPVTDASFKWLEDDLYKNLMRFKRLAPQASILVVGVADMAHKSEGKVTSYASVPLILAAQKRAAERAGCAFWDLYSSMGGKGSIIRWVHRTPPMAAADYAHFSFGGQKLVAELLYKALMNEYTLYRRRILYQTAPPDSASTDSLPPLR